MGRPHLEVADVLRSCASELSAARPGVLTAARRRVVSDLLACRTAALGGHVEECGDCGRVRISYNSCRNRHCPKCQGERGAAWTEAREADLLPVEYFHVVFTVPEEVAELALRNQRLVYGLLLAASARTLKEVARDPGRLGAEIGFLSVLHTWSQTLRHHPHVHCVVPGGGLSPDGSRWIGCRPGFFLPVRVLARVFRGKLLAALGQAFREGSLRLEGRLARQGSEKAFRAWLARARAKDWVVYAKPPFGGPRQVLRYLARYTHRVAIANHRLVNLEAGHVTFRWRDRAHGNRPRAMTLPSLEFARRFLLHVLPRGFARIRYYGILANRSTKLARCKALVGVEPIDEPGLDRGLATERRCPSCGSPHLLRREIAPVQPRSGVNLDVAPAYADTS